MEHVSFLVAAGRPSQYRLEQSVLAGHEDRLGTEQRVQLLEGQMAEVVRLGHVLVVPPDESLRTLDQSCMLAMRYFFGVILCTKMFQNSNQIARG